MSCLGVSFNQFFFFFADVLILSGVLFFSDVLTRCFWCFHVVSGVFTCFFLVF